MQFAFILYFTYVYVSHLFNQIISHSKTLHSLFILPFLSSFYLDGCKMYIRFIASKARAYALCFLGSSICTPEHEPSLPVLEVHDLLFFASPLSSWISEALSYLFWSVFQHHSSNLAAGSIHWLITNDTAVQETVFSKLKVSLVQIRFNFHSKSHIGNNNTFQELLKVTTEVRKNCYLEKKYRIYGPWEKYFCHAIILLTFKNLPSLDSIQLNNRNCYKNNNECRNLYHENTKVNKQNTWWATILNGDNLESTLHFSNHSSRMSKRLPDTKW